MSRGAPRSTARARPAPPGVNGRAARRPQKSHRIPRAGAVHPAGAYTLVAAEPWTGRTHQIPVHLAPIGQPVVGDRVYGRRRSRLPVTRQFLHAWRLGFEHPVAGQRIELEAPLAADLTAVLPCCGNQSREEASSEH